MSLNQFMNENLDVIKDEIIKNRKVLCGIFVII